MILRTLSAVVFVALLAACAGSPEEPPSTEAAEPQATSEAAPESPPMLNANLATREDLEAVIDKAAASAIVAARPLLTLAALHEALVPTLGDEATRELFTIVTIPINLNTASRAEILLVPGVGERMAHEFEEYRPYIAIEQFRREIGKYVDDEEVARLEQYVFVPVNLNSASDEEILAIPGVGNRMLREFKEYRPYTDMAQFRREIGKYVDDNELARLERFVTL